ncbi:MAG: 30S ribosomal protein S1 [Terriglobia bacterium]
MTDDSRQDSPAVADTHAQQTPSAPVTVDSTEKREAAHAPPAFMSEAEEAPNEPLPAEATEATETTASSETEETPAAAATEPEIGAAELEQLIDQYSGDAAPATGEIRTATVVNTTSDGVVVDLGIKSEGLVPRAEFTGEDGQVTIQPGETLEVLLEGSQAREGYVPCSSEGAHRLKLWEHAETAYREQRKVRCRVVERVKGGARVEINLPKARPGRRPLMAFLPGSQVDLRPVRHWEGLFKREIDCRVVRFDRRRGNIVVSRRALLEEERAKKKKLLEEVLRVGAVVTGTVKNLTDYGAFIDLGGLDGLLHVTDMSYSRLGHPSEAVSPGDEVQVKVLKINREKEQVSLGMKQLEPDPWEGVEKKYPVGERVRGRVTHMMDFGAFVELEPGVEGMIHVSEMSWTKRIRHPKDLLKNGDWVEAAVLDVLPREKRISLGLRQTQPDPFQTAAERYPVGGVIRGRVRSLTDFGAFIELEPGVEGLAHKSELTWDKKQKKPAQVLKRGQDVRAKVLKVDARNRRLSLSLKDVVPDPWADFIQQVEVGRVARGKVVRRTKFGAFVELAPGVEGLCHISELPDESSEAVEVGQEYDFRVIKMNAGERRIGLSLKSELARQTVEQFRGLQSRSTATLAEILTAKGLDKGIEKP